MAPTPVAKEFYFDRARGTHPIDALGRPQSEILLPRAGAASTDAVISSLVAGVLKLQEDRVEQMLVKHFGSRERAAKMATLFPGRHQIMWFEPESAAFESLFVDLFSAVDAPPRPPRQVGPRGGVRIRDLWTKRFTNG